MGHADEGKPGEMTRFCTRCGALRSDAANFCAECGAAVGERAATPEWTTVTRLPTFAPPYTGPVGRPRSTNGFAIASMVLGILWIYWIGSILALVFGYNARRQIAESHGTEGGEGMATAGIVLGWIGVGIGVAVFVLGALVAASGSGS